MLQKSKELMSTQMHDFTNGDDNNDDPPLAKCHKFQLPSMSQYINRSLYLLQFNVA